jgi:thiamine-monophosphate kinase
MSGEFELIEWIRGQQAAIAGAAGGIVQVAAGDDFAVLKWPAQDLLLVGVDQVLDGMHFDSAVHAAESIGRKVMNRNLSDCAAMACLPAAAVATVALPRGTGIEYAKALYRGMKEAGERFGCAIVGGDTASWKGKLVVTLTMLGRSDGIEPVLRSGARPGDRIYVTGSLGGSILGRHMDFAPRVNEARQLARTFALSAMIDLSDGLSRDLRHICQQSGVGAIVRAAAVRIHADAIELSGRDGRSPLVHALHDGEDHELLFTTAAEIPADFGVRVTEIGTVTGARGEIVLENADGTRTPLEPLGWEHRL